jgi:hypothetical protein
MHLVEDRDKRLGEVPSMLSAELRLHILDYVAETFSSLRRGEAA